MTATSSASPERQLLDTALAAPRAEGGPLEEMAARVGSRVAARRDDRMRRIREAIFSPPVDGVPGLEDALGMMFCFVRRTVDAQQAADTRARQRRAEVASASQEATPHAVSVAGELPTDVHEYLRTHCRRRLQGMAEQARASELQSLLADIVGTSQLFDQVRRSLTECRAAFENASGNRPPVDAGLLSAFDRRVREDVLKRVGPFWAMILNDAKHRQGFVTALRKSAEDTIAECCLAVVSAVSDEDGSDDPIAEARPTLPCRPGELRWLLSGPSERAVEPIVKRLERQFGQRPSFRRSVDGRVSLICEAEYLPIANIAAGIVGDRVDFLEMAGRVRSRIDVDWKC